MVRPRAGGPEHAHIERGESCKLPVVLARLGSGVIVKKGRHRRFEEARDLKRAVKTEETDEVEPCPECGAEPGNEHASWCLATEDGEYDDEDEDEYDQSDSRPY
jgi:hypothetical protein